MSRLSECFHKQSKSLVPFITAGDPDLALTLQLMHRLVVSGADIIELGIPFSDPMADGPVIQRASDRALANGVGVSDILDLMYAFREQDQTTPVVLMGYLNPIEHMGIASFAKSAQQAGVDGVLIVDLPPEENEQIGAVLADHGVDLIFLVSPTTTDKRMALIAQQARGYLYYVALRGVTGASDLDLEEISAQITALKAHTNLPVLAGFGIKNAQTAQSVAHFSDGVIVGSAIVEMIEANTQNNDNSSAACLDAVGALIQSIRSAI